MNENVDEKKHRKRKLLPQGKNGLKHVKVVCSESDTQEPMEIVAENMSLPIVENQTPVPECRTPVVESRTPVVEGRTPVVESRTPVVEGRTPVMESRTPVAESRTRRRSCQMRSLSYTEPSLRRYTTIRNYNIISDNTVPC